MSILTRAAARLWPPREADRLASALLCHEQAQLREFLRANPDLPRTDPFAYRYLLRQRKANVRISELNVRDLQYGYDYLTRPRWWQRAAGDRPAAPVWSEADERDARRVITGRARTPGRSR